mmetsp:Transcript_9887/g.18027  ORF Transcript_9887/g.18027 Transcript_9887/m.18027 type:complete len:400 (+) Transcript_9887:124-1323(+)|eukprot:CAMPEP_0197530372 /NCGR_PEP_ID=MMETSP1318-20131121/31606_1 /TAXON_ID=552666 /ORGANISM="Partenskyella glossopodia, Strain RCC365" /LENGTH=399 /DNA_ID=CAMNT_0043086167 /DNA_START=115 /DNA_END=1314 /DNA_ORIENTATION=+
MSKRRNERQITKDDVEEGDSESQAKDWKETLMASKEKLAARKILTVKRKGSRPKPAVPPDVKKPDSSTAQPTAISFNFGDTAPAAPAATSTTSTTTTNGGASKPVFSFTSDPAPEATTSTTKAGSSSTNSNTDAAEKKQATQDEKKETSEDSGGLKFNFGSDNTAASAFSFGSGGLESSFKIDTSAPMFKAADSSTAAASGTTGAFSFGDASGGLTFGSFASNDGGGLGSGSNSNSKDDSKNSSSLWTQTSFSLGSSGSGSGSSDAFKDAKPADKGDTNDHTLFKRKSKVFELSGEGSDKTWKERGKGELHINQYEKDGSKLGRLILRHESTKRLVLNCPIHEKMEHNLHADRFIRFLSVNITEDVEDHQKIRVYLVKFKTKTDAQQALDHISAALKSK